MFQHSVLGNRPFEQADPTFGVDCLFFACLHQVPCLIGPLLTSPSQGFPFGFMHTSYPFQLFPFRPFPPVPGHFQKFSTISVSTSISSESAPSLTR